MTHRKWPKGCRFLKYIYSPREQKRFPNEQYPGEWQVQADYYAALFYVMEGLPFKSTYLSWESWYGHEYHGPEWWFLKTVRDGRFVLNKKVVFWNASEIDNLRIVRYNWRKAE